MAVILPKSVFIHTPKTGGNWVTEVLQAAGLIVHNTRDIGHPHAVYADLPSLGYPMAAALPAFTFVRHPALWWRSYWAFKLSNGWDPTSDLDQRCQSPDFHTFIRLVLEHYPGFLIKDYGRYTAGVAYVGRMETLREDLMRILLAVGETFDPATLYSVPPSNTSHPVGCYTAELLRDLMESEREAIEEWGYGLHGYGKV